MKSIVDLSQTEINQLLLTRIAELDRRVAELELEQRVNAIKDTSSGTNT